MTNRRPGAIDLWGEGEHGGLGDRSVVSLRVFCDERGPEAGWLYFGYVFCASGRWTEFSKKLLKARLEADCEPTKRIHFNSLTGAPSVSSRSRCAVLWAKNTVEKWYPDIHFHWLGVKMENIDTAVFGEGDGRSTLFYRLYNTFFQIGLYGACRYFWGRNRPIQITEIVAEKRDLAQSDPYSWYAPYKVNQRQSNVSCACEEVTELNVEPSMECAEEERLKVECLQFADTLTSGFGEVYDCTSGGFDADGNVRKGKAGCIAVARELLPIAERWRDEPDNPNSRYYRRYRCSFYPRIRRSAEDVRLGSTDNLFYLRSELKFEFLRQPSLFPNRN